VTYDLLIIGGGINGCAIAREASLLGLKVLLVERDDLASHTSSASTKLIHGGLRYLEYYEFKLVAEALRERERLLKAAPHLIRPLTFVLPQENAVRPWWMVRIGLYLYDWLGGKISLPRSRGLKNSDTAYTDPLKGGSSGFVYSDARTDDSRLTLLNAIDARDNGAEIVTGVALENARRENGVWRAALSDGRDVEAKALVNAAGPWVHLMLEKLGVNAKSNVRLVKGSHIVVPKLFDGDHAYMLQLPDRRIIFAIAWQGQTEIGTTDIPVDAPEDAQITDDEIAYLCDGINHHFIKQITPADVTSSWSGVRPLYDDGASEAKAVTREYVLELDNANDTGGPPLLSVFGGKITTARHLAEEAMGKLGPVIGIDAHPATRARIFPGGAIANFHDFVAQARVTWPFLGEERATRMAHAYGTMLTEMLDGVGDEAGMGKDFGGGLTEIEARWMRDKEWARTAADALDRRSKIGLTLSPAQRTAFEKAWAELG
jgi:glycerol-3-phosphate dehydrogenase